MRLQFPCHLYADDEDQADPVAAYLAPDDAGPEQIETVRESFRSNWLRRASRGGVFHECPECSTWFAAQRVRAAADERVYCSPRCRDRGRRRAKVSA